MWLPPLSFLPKTKNTTFERNIIMNNQPLYLISQDTYHHGIADKVEAYTLMKYLSEKAKKISTLDDIQDLINSVKVSGSIFDDMFERWGIPEAFLLSGDPEDLKELKEFEVIEYVLEDEVAEQMEDDDAFGGFIDVDDSEKIPLYKILSIAEESSKIISENIHALAPDDALIRRILLQQSGSQDLYESLNTIFELMGLRKLPAYPNMKKEDIAENLFFWHMQNTLTDVLK